MLEHIAMWIKVAIVILLLIIVASLFRGLFFLVQDQGKTCRTVNALTVRVVASGLLILLLFIGLKTGALHPHGVDPANPSVITPVPSDSKG